MLLYQGSDFNRRDQNSPQSLSKKKSAHNTAPARIPPSSAHGPTHKTPMTSELMEYPPYSYGDYVPFRVGANISKSDGELMVIIF